MSHDALRQLIRDELLRGYEANTATATAIAKFVENICKVTEANAYGNAALLTAVEYGFRQHEKGRNLEATLEEARKFLCPMAGREGETGKGGGEG